MLLQLIGFFLVALLVFLAGFLPGYLILLRFAPFLRSDERLASSFGVSFGIIAVVAFAGYLARAWWAGLPLVLLLCLILLLDCRTRNMLVWPKTIMFWLFLIFYLHALLFQVATPYYDKVAYGDWWMHYELSRFYLGQSRQTTFFDGQATITSRTPLFNLAGSFFMSVFGGQFWVFQIGSTLMNSAFILSAWLLSRKIFPKASAAPVLGFGLFNTYLIRSATYTWPKLLAAYFVILALYYYLKQKESGSGTALCGLFSGLAYMAHQYAIVFVVGLGIDYLLFSGRQKKSVKRIAGFALTFLLVLLPWHVWAVSNFGIGGTFLSTPTILQQWGGNSMAFLSKKLAQLYDFDRYPALVWLAYRLSNVVFTLLPIQPVMDVLNAAGSFLNFYYALLVYYLGTMPGALTTSLTLLLLFSARKLLRLTDRSILIVAVAGFFGSVLVTPVPIRAGIASASMLPIVLIFIVMAAGMFHTASRKLKAIVLVGVLIEFFAMSWTQIYLAPGLPADAGNYVLKVQQDVQMAWDYLAAGKFLPIIFVFVVITEIVFLWLAFKPFQQHIPSNRRARF